MQNSVIQEREATLLLEKFRFKTVAILVENNDFGLSFRDNMRRSLERANVRVVLDVAQDRQDANWYSIITRIKGLEPDLVVVSISADQAATFVKQYAESNLKTPLFSDYTPPPYIFEKQVGPLAGRIGLVRGTFFVDSPAATARQKAFVAALRAAGRARGRRAPARRALGHRHLRCGDDRGGCGQARRREHRRSPEVARVHELRRRARPLRIRRRPPDQARGVRLPVRPHDAGRRTRGREVRNAAFKSGINGLILAGNYALVAVGLTLIFGVMRMVNFAQGQSVMLGAFTAFSLAPSIGYVPAILVAMLVNAGLGLVLERTAFRPFRGVELNGLIASMGMSIILVNVAELIWGTTPRAFETSLNQISFTIGSVGVSAQRLLVIVASVLLLLGLWWLIERSSTGRQFRAVAEDPEIAAAFGIDANRVSRRAVVLGSMLAAAAGALSGPVDRDFTANGSGGDAQCVCRGDPGRLRQRQRHDLRCPADRDGTVIRRRVHLERLLELDRVRAAGDDADFLPVGPRARADQRKCLARLRLRPPGNARRVWLHLARGTVILPRLRRGECWPVCSWRPWRRCPSCSAPTGSTR